MTDARPRTRQVVLRPLTLADEAIIHHLLSRLTAYSMTVDGVVGIKNGARKLLDSIPSGMAMSSKHVFAIMSGGTAVGLIDLIDGYPEPATSFVGLLAIAEDVQGDGLGRQAFQAMETFARGRLGSAKLRLAVVASNPVMGFWHRMGFAETGEVRPYQGEAKLGEARMMEKKL